MNSIHKGFIFSIATFFLSGCESGFLEEYPVANLSSQTFFKNEKDFRQATNGIYSNLQMLAGGVNAGTGTGGFWAMSELRSDNSTYQYNTVDLSGMNIPTVDLLNSFEAGDLRKSMIDLSYTDNENWTYNGSIVSINKKYWHEGHRVQFQTATDFILLRYPYVPLMLAECYLETGDGDPAPLVNQVRNRAGLPSKGSYTVDDVLNERRFEFYGEADRWDVLVRTGKVSEIMEKHGENERSSRPELHVGDAAFRNIKALYPIPARAIQTDPNLVQNPEYN